MGTGTTATCGGGGGGVSEARFLVQSTTKVHLLSFLFQFGLKAEIGRTKPRSCGLRLLDFELGSILFSSDQPSETFVLF